VSQLPTSKSSSQEESTFMPNDFKTWELLHWF
jgi:hypothetical protein